MAGHGSDRLGVGPGQLGGDRVPKTVRNLEKNCYCNNL
jgi:hypothetical protein